MKSKKGIMGLSNTALAFGVTVIVVSIVAVVVSNLNATQTANTAAANATRDGLTGLTNMSTNFGLLGTVLIFSIILAVVIGFLGRGGK